MASHASPNFGGLVGHDFLHGELLAIDPFRHPKILQKWSVITTAVVPWGFGRIQLKTTTTKRGCSLGLRGKKTRNRELRWDFFD